ncbi:MAG: RHS repeat-associated core domain-containing protein, partial [Ignavibacteria bacterium]|nr:RHS repeat-associated core domain-containing protein [Ignavibacteria bacterium]
MTRWYIGNSYIKEVVGGVTKEYNFIGGDVYTAPVVAVIQSGTITYYYLLRDHLGNITHQVNTSNTVVAEYNFDAWGRRRSADDWSYTLDANDLALFADRGFTGHEHLTLFNLVNMNGRLYDPLVGRFLNVDPYVQMPDYSQNVNRYSYCLNNPLKFSDESGEFLTWSFGKGSFSIGFNLTPIGIPLGAGLNFGWSNGFSAGGYGEVGYRVGGTGLGSGVTVSQGLNYNFKHTSWSTTTSEGAYASFGPFNAGANLSQTYNMTNNQWSNGWGVSAGIGIGNDKGGIGFTVGYGSGGWSYGLGGYYNPPKPAVYKSPVSDNYGSQNGECALRCFEEFSDSYGMSQYDYDYWLNENGNKLGVHATKIEGLIDNTGVFSSDRIAPQTNINTIAEAFTNDKRVLMAFKTSSGGAHAVMVSKVKIWPSGRYKVYFSET